MADVDEADILRIHDQDRNQDHSDEEGEAQDFRLLSVITGCNKKDQVLPRRGIKDFEPHGTQAQNSTLLASQEAMREALSFEVSYPPDTALVAVFNAKTGQFYVAKESGVHFKMMGKGVSYGGVMLEPEEALYLCERGSLELRFGARSEDYDIVGIEDVSLEGLSMSLQAAYAMCIGTRGLTLERYLIYANLKRAGYWVYRAPGAWEDIESTEPVSELILQSKPASLPVSLQSWFQKIIDTIIPFSNRKQCLPILGTSFFRDYRTIYTRLDIIPTYKPISLDPQGTPSTKSTRLPPRSLSPLEIAYHVYRPNTAFRKASRPRPELFISVLDAQDTAFPTPTQISDLIASVASYDPPAPSPRRRSAKVSNDAETVAAKDDSIKGPTALPKVPAKVVKFASKSSRPMTSPMAKLKQGGQSVILAVVDNGLTSYVRVSEGLFSETKMWENHPAVKGKAGGAGGKGEKGSRRSGNRGKMQSTA